MSQIRFLTLAPWWLGGDIGVATGRDDHGHLLTEPRADRLKRWLTASVLYRVVEQGGDSFVFRASVLDNQRCHRKQVRHIRDLRPLTKLTGVIATRLVNRR